MRTGAGTLTTASRHDKLDNEQRETQGSVTAGTHQHGVYSTHASPIWFHWYRHIVAAVSDEDAIPDDETRLLDRVKASLASRVRAVPAQAQAQRYDAELVALRDEIGEARREDVPALVAQMERLQGVSLRRAEAQALLVDPQAPYFGHLRLRERSVNAARSMDRTVERDVLIGRATFVDAALRVNIVDWRNAPVSALYYRHEEGSDYDERFGDRDVEGEILARRTLTISDGDLTRIACPQGEFSREPDAWRRTDPDHAALAGGEGTATRATGRGVLGAAALREQRLDRRLPEIAALIDPRQFDLITALDAGVVVIQGGAGSGKTTIGLHRIAYLAYAFPNRFRPAEILVTTFGAALAAYIGQVLPALGVHGVPVVTFAAWARQEIDRALPGLRAKVSDETPGTVARVKSHPALLRELERRARAHTGKKTTRAIIDLWAELLTDRPRLQAIIQAYPQAPISDAEIADAHRFMVDRVAAVVDRDSRPRALRARRTGTRRLKADAPDDDDVRGQTGIDGVATDDDEVLLDLEDVAMLLRVHQIIRGGRGTLAHLFIDEAQDLSPLQLAVLVAQTTSRRSVTLAGDTAQRLFLDNGFGDWRSTLSQLGLDHVAVEPLRIAYRSTREILALARHAMGALADAEPPTAPRSGAPVEVHRFPGTGAAVGFLAEALRPLFAREPRATVAILARHPEQADRYHDGLRRADIPGLRRVRAQEFSFRPGVEVTEIRQVKGLEFDYVILVDTNANTFGRDDESRHLFHIGATRAAHQLWLIVTATPSPLIPPELLRE